MESWHRVEWPEAASTTGQARAGRMAIGSANKHYNTDTVRIWYKSLTAPQTVVNYNMFTREKEIVPTSPVPGYDQTYYDSERFDVTVRDGTKVPVSLVYRKDLRVEGAPPAPLLLYGYGSYGASMDPEFSMMNLPLLDRGVVYAIAHIRGGGEMGRAWYEKEGKYLTKKNTFNDFVDVAEHLVSP